MQLGVSLKALQTSLDSRKSEVAQCQLSYVLAGAAGSLHLALKQGCAANEMVQVLDAWLRHLCGVRQEELVSLWHG